MKSALKPKAGSFVWLVAHDMRLNWRRFVDMFCGMAPHHALIIAIAGVLILHALAWPALPWLAAHVAGPATPPESRLLIGGALVCIASWMTAQGLFAATRTLYDRGDLDLLLSSPQDPSRILAAKAIAIALSSLGSVAVLALPLANVGAWRYGRQWLAAYPTLASLALGATALSLLATIGLFHAFGPRRARIVSHLAGALIGGAFVLGAQVLALLPDATRHAITTALAPTFGSGAQTGLVWLPVDALLADPHAMIAVLVSATAMFAAAVALLGGQFARACLAAAGSTSAAGSAAATPVRFRSGPARALRRKEWRLLLRDPSLFAQLGLQIVYTIPLAVVLVRSGSLPIALAMTPAIVVIAAQVAASLAWIAVSGEDAPELIACAPVNPAVVDAAKLSAIAIPVALVALVPLAGLALASPSGAAIAAIFALGASVSTSLLNLWHPMPGNRRGMLRRHSQSKLIGLLEHAIAVLWAIAAVLAMLGTLLWLPAVMLACAVLCQGQIKLWRRAAGPVPRSSTWRRRLVLSRIARRLETDERPEHGRASILRLEIFRRLTVWSPGRTYFPRAETGPITEELPMRRARLSKLTIAAAALAASCGVAQAYDVQEIGSLYVGGRPVTLSGLAQQVIKIPGGDPIKIDPNGDYHTGQMYAQYVKLSHPAARYPLLMWHTGGITGASWETKPDGKPGWQQFFLKHGHSVYVSDAVERGRATFSRPEIYKSDPVFRDKRDGWEIFRIGPPNSYKTNPVERRANPGVLFPLDAFDTVQMQMAARWAVTGDDTQAAYNQYVQRVCPCVIIAHGQAGLFAFRTALAMPDKVKALIAIEPAFAPTPDHPEVGKLKNTPHLWVWGDYISTNPTWVGHVKGVRPYHDALVSKGVSSTWMDLPASGINGNTHMPMMDTNSDIIAAKVQAWMTSHGLMNASTASDATATKSSSRATRSRQVRSSRYSSSSRKQ